MAAMIWLCVALAGWSLVFAWLTIAVWFSPTGAAFAARKAATALAPPEYLRIKTRR